METSPIKNMISLLNWEKLKKPIAPTKEAVGAYYEGMKKWRATYISKGDRRVEIRRLFSFRGEGTVRGYGAQVLIVVRPSQKKHPTIVISANSKIAMNLGLFKEMDAVVGEALDFLFKNK